VTTYTDIFGGNTIYPSDVSHLALGLSADTALSWPLDANLSETIAARIIDVTPSADGFSVALPDATQVGSGQTVLFNNVSGAHSFFVTDAAGGVLATVEAGTQWQLYLALNTSTAGTWRVFRFGASTADVQPSALAGFGLVPTGSTLSVAVPVTTFSTTGLTVSTSNRGGAMVWTGAGSGTLNMLSAASAGNNFFLAVRNSGGGDLTLDPSGSETINGATSLALRPGDSVQLITDGAAWYTIGLGQDAEFAFDYTSISVTTGTHVLAGSELNRIAYKFVGTLTGNVTVVVPATIQQYWINNATTGAYTLSFKTASGSPVQVNQGARGIYYCDGTEFILADTASVSLPISIAQGGTGALTASAARLSLGVSAFADAIVTAANGASVRTTIGAAASGANTDITSLALGLGSVGAPSLAFTGDANTGVFSPGADQLTLVTGGASRIEIGSGGETTFLGAATNRPSIVAKNTTADTSPGYFSFQKIRNTGIVQSGDDLGILGAQGYDGSTYRYAAWIRFNVDGTPGAGDMPGKIGFAVTADGASVPVERMALTAYGLGINITPPTSTVLRLSVAGDIMLAGASRMLGLNLYYEGSEFRYGANGYGWALAEASGVLTILRAASNAGGAGATATTAAVATFNSTGLVLPGASGLTFSSVANFYMNAALGSGNPGINFDTNDFLDYNRSSNKFSVVIGGTTRLIVDNGNVGIGTASPSEALTVSGNARIERSGTSSQYVLTYGDASANFVASYSLPNNAKTLIHECTTDTSNTTPTVGGVGHIWKVLGTEYMRISQAGNVGIGTASPSQKLHVAGTILSNNLLLQGDNTDAYLRPTNVGGHLFLGANGTNFVQLTSGGVLRPVANGTQDLGASSLAWASGFINALVGVSATLSGALSAASATLSGALSAASASISGAITAASGSVSGAFSIGTLSLTNDLGVTHGGTGASSASAARSNLGAQAQTTYTANANGYCVATDVGGGVTHLRQWGRITVPANSTATITFPVAFTNLASISCSGNGAFELAPGAQDNGPAVYAVPNVNTASVYSAANGSCTFFWVADGV